MQKIPLWETTAKKTSNSETEIKDKMDTGVNNIIGTSRLRAGRFALVVHLIIARNLEQGINTCLTEGIHCRSVWSRVLTTHLILVKQDQASCKKLGIKRDHSS